MTRSGAAGPREQALLEMSFSPNMKLVSKVRRFVSDFYAEVLGDEMTSSMLALATHELLENAVKCSTDQMSKIRIEVTFEDPGGRVFIRTWNRATPTNLAALEAFVGEMVQEKDPMAHYQKLMKRSAVRREGSGLGLGRIRAEAGMELSYQLEGDQICVLAQARWQQGAQS